MPVIELDLAAAFCRFSSLTGPSPVSGLQYDGPSTIDPLFGLDNCHLNRLDPGKSTTSRPTFRPTLERNELDLLETLRNPRQRRVAVDHVARRPVRAKKGTQP